MFHVFCQIVTSIWIVWSPCIPFRQLTYWVINSQFSFENMMHLAGILSGWDRHPHRKVHCIERANFSDFPDFRSLYSCWMKRVNFWRWFGGRAYAGLQAIWFDICLKSVIRPHFIFSPGSSISLTIAVSSRMHSASLL